MATQERLLLACGGRLLGESLERTICEACQVPEVVRARSFEQLLPLAASQHWSYAVFVAPFPGLESFGDWADFRALQPTVPVTFLVPPSMTAECLWQIWRGQPASILHRDCHIDDLVFAVNGMRRSLLVLGVQPAWATLREPTNGSGPAHALNGTKLSSMEVKVLQGFADGLTEKEVAAKLRIGHRTVQSYAAGARRKLGGDRIQAVMSAARMGIITTALAPAGLEVADAPA